MVSKYTGVLILHLIIDFTGKASGTDVLPVCGTGVEGVTDGLPFWGTGRTDGLPFWSTGVAGGTDG